MEISPPLNLSFTCRFCFGSRCWRLCLLPEVSASSTPPFVSPCQSIGPLSRDVPSSLMSLGLLPVWLPPALSRTQSQGTSKRKPSSCRAQVQGTDLHYRTVAEATWPPSSSGLRMLASGLSTYSTSFVWRLALEFLQFESYANVYICYGLFRKYSHDSFTQPFTTFLLPHRLKTPSLTPLRRSLHTLCWQRSL